MNTDHKQNKLKVKQNVNKQPSIAMTHSTKVKGVVTESKEIERGLGGGRR